MGKVTFMRIAKSVIIFSISLFFLVSLTTHAADRKPAWLQPEVVKSALAINMTEEQQPKFQNAITVYLTNFQKSFKKIVSGRDTSGMERKIKRMNKGLKNQWTRFWF